ncbi:MAG: tetratricopeptide repeat protein, partial [Desulfobacteraceae bacterium]|nr:tetratricopeptide repeat protein [Desulfobacteraceae bacterium]
QMRDSSHREETRWIMELLLMLYSPSAIVKERSKVKANINVERPTTPYEKLIVQTADFVTHNPDYCKIIELCIDSTINGEKGTIIDTKEKELIEEAFNYTDKNQYDEAIKVCENILKTNSKFYQAFGVMGESYRLSGQYEKAIQHYKKAIKINPKSEVAYWSWGACLRDQERFEQAIGKFKKAIKINPKSGEAYWSWGACLRDQKRYKEAIGKFKKSIKLDPKSYPAHGALGDCYRDLGQYDEAEINYKKAINLNPKSGEAYWSWGACLRDQKQYEEAIGKFKKAIKINPKSYSAHGALGDCCRGLGQYDEAEIYYKKAIELNPNYHDAYAAWGDCLRLQERYEEAIGKLKKAIKLNPNYYHAFAAWGYCLQLQEQYEEAIGKFKKAIKINPKSDEAYWNWGDCLLGQGNYEEAIHLFEKYFPESKDNDVICSYGRSLMGIERYDKALEQFELIIKSEPEYKKLYLYYGQLMEKMNNNEFALTAYLKHINSDYIMPSADFDFQKTYSELITPLIKKLKPNNYIKHFYVSKKERKFSESQLSIFLILLDQYDTVSEHFKEIISKHRGKSIKEKDDFSLLIFTLKLSVWHKLYKDNLHDALRLMNLYIEYIKTLEKTAQKENEVSDFFLSLFKLQNNSKIDSKNIKEALQQFENQKDIPFSNIFSKVWTCLSEPDSVEAQRFINEKAIAEVVKEIKN